MSRDFIVDVTPQNGAINNVINNTVEEIPKTGISVWEYVIYVVVLAVIISFGYVKIRNAKK